MTDPHQPPAADADDVERHPCPRCAAAPGSPCRSRAGAVAGTYHTGRFTKVPRLAKLLRVQTPADRGPGQPRWPGTPPPAPTVPDAAGADIRIGYARCSPLGQELDSQLDALAGHGIDRHRIFSEKISTRIRIRPQFEAALAAARGVKAHAPHCRVVLTVYGMKRLGRDAAELTVLGRRVGGESVEQIQPDLIIPTGKRKGLNPSVAGIYRALADHERTQAYPEAIEAAHADFAALCQRSAGTPTSA
ncbi:zinc finger domain-containing protein [Streptomyces griseoviridis]|uniref:zinc finger domain-containing protein n=1 Tax=Streptomyces griseoviridis TaxID=45398 RepID=UPI0034519F34